MYFLTTFCGVCLMDRREVQNINNKDTDDISLVEKLKYCSFKTAWIGDDLPLFICYKCYGNLKIAYSFRKKCATNSAILKGYVSRLKCGRGSLNDDEFGHLRVEVDRNKIYGVNVVLHKRVQVEEIDMDISSSDEEENLDCVECADVEKPMPLKLESEAGNKLMCNSARVKNVDENNLHSNNDKTSASWKEQNTDKYDKRHTEHRVNRNSALCKINQELKEEIVDIKEEPDKDICFAEVKQEFDANMCDEIEPDNVCATNVVHDDRSQSVKSNFSSSKRNRTPRLRNILSKPSICSTQNSSNSHSAQTAASTRLPGSELNLLTIINKQISHFLTTNETDPIVRSPKTVEKTQAIKSPEFSTLRSILEGSATVQNRMPDVKYSATVGNHENGQQWRQQTTDRLVDNVEYLSSASDTNEDETILSDQQSEFTSVDFQQCSTLGRSLGTSVTTDRPEFMNATGNRFETSDSRISISSEEDENDRHSKNNASDRPFLRKLLKQRTLPKLAPKPVLIADIRKRDLPSLSARLDRTVITSPANTAASVANNAPTNSLLKPLESRTFANILQPRTVVEPQSYLSSIETNHAYILPSRSEPPPYLVANDISQRFPLLTDSLNTTPVSCENYILPPATLGNPLSYPGTTEPANTYLIIYNDMKAPTVANNDTNNSFILPKSNLVQTANVPFSNSTEVSNAYLVPSASTVPLVINSEVSGGYVLPTSSLSQTTFSYHSESSNNTLSTSESEHFGHRLTQRSEVSHAHILPTGDGEMSSDSERSDVITTFCCPICKEIFTRNTYLRKHFETHYSLTHRCSICAKNFMNEKTLKVHILAHKGGMKYRCDYCQKMFSELGDFKKHSSSHVNVKQFQCSMCEKRFFKRSSLTKHLASHSDGKSHQCTLCSQVFQYKCRLDNHMTKDHNVEK